MGAVSLNGSKGTLRLVDESAKLGTAVLPAKRADRREAWESLKAAASKQKGALRVRVKGVAKAVEARGGQTWSLILHQWTPLDYKAEVVVQIEELACEQCSTRTMRALRELAGVIHAQADHEKDVVHVWTTTASPDVKLIRQRIEKLGFKVKDVQTRALGKGK